MATAEHLRELGNLLWEMAVAARADGESDDFQRGCAFGLYQAVSLVEQQAAAFGLSGDDVGLGGRCADDLLRAP